MFFRKKRTGMSDQENYRFEYHFGIKNGPKQGFSNSEFATLDEANAARSRAISAFTAAITEDSAQEVDDGFFVRGAELAWFWVGEVGKK